MRNLLDVAGHTSAMAGRAEALTTAEMRGLTKAATPLAFWRRGVTQAAPADLAETTQPTSQISKAASDAGR